MYCFKCGKAISDDAVFCQFCGTKQNRAPNYIVPNQSYSVRTSSSSKDLDREALKIYLRNILSLEYIKQNYERRMSNLRYEIQQYNKNDYTKKYVLRRNGGSPFKEKRCVHFLFNGKLHLLCYDDWTPMAYDYIPDDINASNWKHIEKDSDLNYLSKANWRWDFFLDTANYSMGFLQKWTQRDEAKNAFLKAYEEFKTEAPLIYESNIRNNNEIRKKLQTQLHEMDLELQKIRVLLWEAYEINIIPSKFRNSIHAIYYLLEFISTSSESFTTALLHFDLDEIKNKLDKIISQNEYITIQNAVKIAQNDKLLKQNQQKLEYLSKIENNTNQAAQYAEIAASNAKTCAWISVANYIETHR